MTSDTGAGAHVEPFCSVLLVLVRYIHMTEEYRSPRVITTTTTNNIVIFDFVAWSSIDVLLSRLHAAFHQTPFSFHHVLLSCPAAEGSNRINLQMKDEASKTFFVSWII